MYRSFQDRKVWSGYKQLAVSYLQSTVAANGTSTSEPLSATLTGQQGPPKWGNGVRTDPQLSITV